MARGSIYKRCGCRDPVTGAPLGSKCPQLRRGRGWNSKHGSWAYRQELPPRQDGSRRTPIRRGGLASKDRAEQELQALQALLELADNDDQPAIETITTIVKEAIAAGMALPGAEQVSKRLRAGPSFARIPTVGEWLTSWLATKKTLAEATLASYEGHIRNYLIPYLGQIRIDRLTLTQVADMFDWIDERNEQIAQARHAARQDRRTLPHSERRQLRDTLAALRWQKPIGAAGKQRVRATLRAALNAFITASQGLITFNPAAHLELPSARAAKPQVWTEERIARWRETGDIPAPVMVWTPQQTAVFLDSITDDPLYALFHMLAFYGPRRGEALGLLKADLNRKTKTVTIRWQVSSVTWTPQLKPPKTEASNRTLPVDDHTMIVLEQHLQRQETERAQAGSHWTDSGLIFTNTLGGPLHSQQVSDYFKDLITQAGLPPVRLHGLRHGAATVLLAAGVDMKIVQEILGHTQLATTADLYTSVLNELTRDALTQSAALINQHRVTPAAVTTTPHHQTTEPGTSRQRKA